MPAGERVVEPVEMTVQLRPRVIAGDDVRLVGQPLPREVRARVDAHTVERLGVPLHDSQIRLADPRLAVNRPFDRAWYRRYRAAALAVA
jgi:hypothetical protein